MPRGRLVADAQVSTNPAADVEAIDIARTVLVDAPAPDVRGPAGTATLVEERPGRLVFDVAAAAPQILVTGERFHPGWRAEGPSPLTPIRAYADYLACLVPEGSHRITLVFDPPSFRHGLRLTLAGVLLTVVVVLIVARRASTKTE